ncbi:MAG: hypothetical protein AMK73_06245 [Planctomycetes bacterium SM23_32]|nr:MAG: hypothetical protein AMK73_06245 [Planctomycetes bacterium SM23_32]
MVRPAVRRAPLRRLAALPACALLCLMASFSAVASAAGPPTVGDVMGICGHFHFDGPTYAPAASQVRNYHDLGWDLDVRRPYQDPPYPFALNRVNWEVHYAGWRRAGFEVSACIMLGSAAPPAEWAAPEEAAYGFGKAFAAFFGPSHRGLVGTVELGNEPGTFSDEQYTAIARAMSGGLREGDPEMRIATAALTLGESHRYAKSIACYRDWLDGIDVLNLHAMALKGEWPDRVRTYPEDPESDFLERVRALVAWRDEHAPDKEVWVSGFGWDAHVPEGAPLRKGVPLDQRPSTLSRLQQAQYLLRAFLLFARHGVDRGYVYYYQDDGPAQGAFNASGLISKGVRQPAYYAMASLKAMLGGYRFAGVLEEERDGVHAYRFEDDHGRICVAVWNATRDGEERDYVLHLEAAGLGDLELLRAAEPSFEYGGQKSVDAQTTGGAVKLTAGGTPRLIFFGSAGGAVPRVSVPMKDFMGLCGHYHFRGATYAPVGRLVRNYHGINWDLDVTQPYEDPPYPFALNRVNWETLYGEWRQAGFEIDASLMISVVEPDQWLLPEAWAYNYGRAFARFFGPSNKALVHTAELGNEPGKYSDRDYGRIARAMAIGLKQGDPQMRVATAAVTLGESGDFAKSISCYEGWLDLVDVINVHAYAMKGQWPNRRRTHPEDPESDFLRSVRQVLAWRDEVAPDKPVWVTEFGWDAHRAEGAPIADGVPLYERASAVSRVQQAQFLLRAYLLFARLGVERAYMYWYRDEGADKGQHNASGIVSNGVKQPAFHAMASLYANLGDYAFARALREELDGVYAYRFDAPGGRSCLAVWTATWDGAARACRLDLTEAGLAGCELVRTVGPAMWEGGEAPVQARLAAGSVELSATGTPGLLFFEPAPGE